MDLAPEVKPHATEMTTMDGVVIINVGADLTLIRMAADDGSDACIAIPTWKFSAVVDRFVEHRAQS